MEEKKPAGLAIASMVLGIVSFALGGCLTLFTGGILGFVFIVLSIVGVILGAVALKKVKDGVGGGKGMAIAGIILNILSLIPSILVIVLGGALLGAGIADGIAEGFGDYSAVVTTLPTFFIK